MTISKTSEIQDCHVHSFS